MGFRDSLRNLTMQTHLECSGKVTGLPNWLPIQEVILKLLEIYESVSTVGRPTGISQSCIKVRGLSGRELFLFGQSLQNGFVLRYRIVTALL